MNEPQSAPWHDWIDAYLDGILDEQGIAALESHLRNDAEARRYFVRYAQLQTDLLLEVRARRASEQAFQRIEVLATTERAGPRRSQSSGWVAGTRFRSLFRWRFMLPAASILAIVAGVAWFASHQARDESPTTPIAWLVNAQNCRWTEGEPSGDMRAGTMLSLEQGLAEVRFQCGAHVLLQSPAKLELVSPRGARLLEGKLTARASGVAAGFEILSPQGKVIDLGTEFGVSVAPNGTTDVYVFEGKVEAHPAGSTSASGVVSLTRDQVARIAAGTVTVGLPDSRHHAASLVRAIVPPPVIRPRRFALTLERLAGNGLCDSQGRATGLTHRLPGTGLQLSDADPNLRIDPAERQLELTTTNSDLNTQFRLGHGEYLGIRLSELGFTGSEDFAATVTFANIPALEFVGQFGLYAGTASDHNIRGGLISTERQKPGRYTQFLVNNDDGKDADIGSIGLLSTGADLRLTLKRVAGKFALTVDNLTAGSSSTLTIRHPEFLDGARDLYVGLFGANTQSNVRKTLIVKGFEATVWTVARPATP